MKYFWLVVFLLLSSNCYAQTHISYGDSITYSEHATSVANGYASLLATDEGNSLTNNGASGLMACEIAEQALAQNLNSSHNPVQTIMVGTNEAIHKSAGSYEAVYKNCHQASLAWLAIPYTFKVFAQNTACVKTGSWSSDNTYISGLGEISTTNGSSLTCSIQTYGGPIYAWYRLIDGDGGAFNYSIDGGSTTGLTTATSPAISTALGGTHGIGLIRITGVSAGVHILNITVTSSTSANNHVHFLASGTVAPYPTWSLPSVLVGGVPKQQNNTQSPDTSAYNTDALDDANLLAGDGLHVYPVDIRNYLNDTSDMYDFAHPNNTGHSHLRDAFMAAEQLIPNYTSSNFIQVSAASGSVNLFNSTPTNIISKTIPPGEWLLSASCDIYASGNGTLHECGLNTVSATMPGTATGNMSQHSNAGCSGCRQVLPLGPININLTAATTYYLVSLCNFSGGTCVAGGVLSATRIR